MERHPEPNHSSRNDEMVSFYCSFCASILAKHVDGEEFVQCYDDSSDKRLAVHLGRATRGLLLYNHMDAGGDVNIGIYALHEASRGCAVKISAS